VKGSIDLEVAGWEYEAQFDLNISDISLLVDFFLNLNEDKLAEFELHKIHFSFKKSSVKMQGNI